MNMSYKVVQDKVVICKNGVYMSLTSSQILELEKLLQQIKNDPSVALK